MPGQECYHCKQMVEAGEAHDCWTTTETALTADLSEELRDAWERLRDTATDFGEQRIYASHHSIMFARKACYFFVRPRKNALELCVFLGRTLRAPQIRRTDKVSQIKVAHTVHITHRDEVESPITDWLREAYNASDALSHRGAKKAAPKRKPRQAATAKRKKKIAGKSSVTPKAAGTRR